MSFAKAIADRGWAVTRRVLDDTTILALRAEVASLAVDGRGGARNLLENAGVRALAASHTVRGFASAVLGDRCFAVRALLFDKTPAANWKVVWHQDLTIPTRERVDVPKYGPWTDKAGVPHVAFRPLLLHASAPARAPGHRRVLHIEFASCELAPPLEWRWRVAQA
jgi:hypothetical protein